MPTAAGCRSSFSLILWGALFAAAAGVAHADEPAPPAQPPHWGYSGATGPTHWGAEDPSYATCDAGHHQSPINIRDAETVDLPPLQFSYQPVPLDVTDTKHSFQVNVPAGSGGITVGADHYDLVQLHFHRPSEERVNGQPYEMVVHMVHKNAKGELAVVALLIRRGKTNPLLKAIFDDFPKPGQTDSAVPGVTLDLNQLLPKRHGYYTFDGSLTTPPCSEQVRWFVLKQPITASAGQIGQFAARYPHNARPTQALYDRKIQQTKD